MKNILVLLLVTFSTVVYAQPANDTCYQAIPIILANGYGTFSGNTQGATPSNTGSFSDNCLAIASQPVEDVWYKFNSGTLYNNYKIQINSNSLDDDFSFDVLRGICLNTVQVFFTVGCVYDTLTECSPIELTLVGLDPSTEYWIRVSSNGNPTSFTGTMTPFEVVVMHSNTNGGVDSTCNNLVWDSGGYLNNYGPLEDYTHTVAPKDTHDFIAFNITDYAFEADTSIDGLYFYKGDTVNPDSLVATLDGSGMDTTVYVFTDKAVTVRFQSDSLIHLEGFEMTYECALINSDDVAVVDILKNDSDCFMSKDDTISIVIQNFGQDTISNFPVSYQVSGKLISTETFTKMLPPCSRDTFTFVQTVNLVNSWNSTIYAWTDLVTDIDETNDTLAWQLNCVCDDSLGTPYICNQMVIQFDENATQAEINQIKVDLANAGGHVIDTVECGGVRLDAWSLPDVLDWFGTTYIGSESQVEGLKTTTAKIKEIDLNYLTKSSSINFNEDFNPLDNNTYNENIASQFNKIEKVMQTQNSTDTVKIVILDTGYDPSSLSSNIGFQICPTCTGLPQHIPVGYDFVNLDEDPIDDNGHGTNVTRVITRFANINNLTNFHLVPIKILDANGEGSLWNIALGVLMAKSLNADIVNASFGWTGSESQIIYELIDALGDSCHGVFIASSGNEAANNDLLAHHPSNGTQFLDNVISVAAFDTSGSIAWYSNHGLTSVDVAAAGFFIANGQMIAQGTSIAAPHVTGYVMKALLENPNVNANQIKSCIQNINEPTLNASGNVIINNTLKAGTALKFLDCIDTTTIDASCRVHSCFATYTSTFQNHQPQIEFHAYPNPFRNEVSFRIDLDEPQEVYLSVYDVTGRMVYNIYKPYLQGKQQITWSTNNLPNGVYFCHLKTSVGNGVVKIVKQ